MDLDRGCMCIRWYLTERVSEDGFFCTMYNTNWMGDLGSADKDKCVFGAVRYDMISSDKSDGLDCAACNVFVFSFMWWLT